jgi:hypothetical protein
MKDSVESGPAGTKGGSSVTPCTPGPAGPGHEHGFGYTDKGEFGKTPCIEHDDVMFQKLSLK